MRTISKIFLGLFLLIFLMPLKSEAREKANITDWYIKNFQSEIIVNKDSSLDITEKITADCGNLPDKHGIYRVLPTQVYKTSTEVIKTPIKLISVTDFNGRPVHYEESSSFTYHTISWKIGDSDRTVTGENNYIIKYKVKNAIRFFNEDFDELYWNLNGNFWEIETDSFTGKIVFPAEITQANTKIDYYTGSFGAKSEDGATYSWSADNILEFNSTRTLKSGEGITASVIFPKNIFTPYKPGFFEKYWQYFSFILPIISFIICFLLWAKFGNDPNIKGPIVPEFEVPGGLKPMEMGEVMTNGKLSTNHVSAGIINMAVNKMIKIEKAENKDYKLMLLKKELRDISEAETLLIEELFSGKDETMLSKLKNKFYSKLGTLEDSIKKKLEKEKLIGGSNSCLRITFIMFAVFAFPAVFFFIVWWILALNLLLTSIIFIIFAILIPRRSVEAVQMMRKIEGFKLYMKTAEKYRQQFNEKENIFEKYLPYAMIFGITGLWIEKIKKIYGQDYFNTYHPIWFIGPGFEHFDAGSFDNAISSLSSNMSSTLASAPSASGSGGWSGGGGGGFSGGGGGGGGGGGW